MENMDWYNLLIKPPLTPDSQVFVIVWPVLYFLILLSFIVFFRNAEGQYKTKAIFYFSMQMLLNIMWSPVFFTMKSVGGALFILILLLFFLVLTLFYFYKSSKSAAFLLVPYALWSCFALYLNLGIFILN